MKMVTIYKKATMLSAGLFLAGSIGSQSALAQFNLENLIPNQNANQSTSSSSSDKHPLIVKYLKPGDQYWNTISLNTDVKMNQVISKCSDSVGLPTNCPELASQMIFDHQSDPDLIVSSQEVLSTQASSDNASGTEFVFVPKIGGVSMLGRSLIDWGIEYLGLAGAKEAVPTLSGLIDSDLKCTNLVCRQKSAIVKSLWMIGDKSASKVIASSMENTKCNSEHKRYGAYWLGLWKSKDAIGVCKKAFKEEKDGEVLTGCMNYLGMVQEKSATAHILRILQEQEKGAVQALTVMADAEAIDGLKELLTKYSDNQYLNRIPILVALASSGHAPAWQEVVKKYLSKGQEDMTLLITGSGVLLKDGKLGAQVKKDFAAALAATKGTDENAQLNRMALNSALAQMGDKNALNAILKELNSSNADLRERALDALGGNTNYSYSPYTGYGLVGISDTSILPKLKAFYEVESKEGLQLKALAAASEISARAKSAGN